MKCTVEFAEAVLGCGEEWEGPDADENGRGSKAVQPELALSAWEADAGDDISATSFAFADATSVQSEGKTLK